MLQISLWALLRVDAPTPPVNVLISEYQDERASREMLENIVQGDSECTIERWSSLRGTSFWYGHFVVEFAYLANIQGIGLLFHCLLLSTVRFEPTLQRDNIRIPHKHLHSCRTSDLYLPVH